MNVAKTLPDLLAKTRAAHQNPRAFCFRHDDDWHPISTEEFFQQVQDVTFGLLALDLKRGENVGILSQSSPFWVMADLAILSAGGITTPIFKKISPENLAYELKDAQLGTIFLGSREAYDEVCAVKNKLEHIIAIGFTVSEDPRVIPLSELAEKGRQYRADNGTEWHDLTDKLSPDDVATIIYTSGSTGVPKGVILTHANILSQVTEASALYPIGNEGKAVLSVLPLAHIFEKMVIYFYLSTNASIHFSDDIKKTGIYLREVKPVCFTVVPRILEKVYAKIANGVNESHGIKGVIAKGAFQRAQTKDPAKPGKTFKDKIYNKMVYSKFQEALGGELKYLISGAAPMSVEVGRFMMNIGIPLYEGYGLTEASPVLACNYPGNNKLGTVGKVFPSVEIKISSEGEVLARGPGIMQGYYKQKKSTSQTLVDGWLHTGDLGSLDSEGFLSIQGRKKELFKKSTGEYVPPIPIEQALNKHPIVENSMIIADGREFVTALLFPDLEALPIYKSKMGADESSDELFLLSTALQDDLSLFIEEVNKHLHHCEEVHGFRMMAAPLSIETGELTPTMKVRRKTVESRYRDLIEEMYKSHRPGEFY